MSKTEEIRARLDEATPGPWKADTAIRGDCVVWGPDGQFLLNQQAEPHWLPDANGKQRMVAFDVDRRDCEFIAHAPEDIAHLLAEVERLTSANDRLAKIASSVAVALEQGKRDLMAHGWETATAEWLTRGDLYWLKSEASIDPLTYNPFRGEPEGLES